MVRSLAGISETPKLMIQDLPQHDDVLENTIIELINVSQLWTLLLRFRVTPRSSF